LHVTKLISFCVDCGYGPVNRQVADAAQVTKDRSRLKRFAASHLSPGANAEIMVRNGNASDQILCAAKETPTDLIVLYAHEMNPPDGVGSHETADRVMRCAPCPVLVVRPHEHEFIPPTLKRHGILS
jgi:nucleotide-binding universal stress UspA family protein